jgi:hypothetical protein
MEHSRSPPTRGVQGVSQEITVQEPETVTPDKHLIDQ